MVNRTRRAVLPSTVAALTTLAVLPLDRVYHGRLLTWLLIGAAAGSVAVSALVRRLPAWTAGPASALVLGGYSLLAARVAARAGEVPGTTVALWWDALRNGVPRLLTALVPVEPQPDTVLVPLIATWLAGLAGAELALRTRYRLGSLAPAIVLYAATLVLLGPGAAQPRWALLVAAVASVGLAADAGPAHADPAHTDSTGAEPAQPGRSAAALPWRVRGRLLAGTAGALAMSLVAAIAVAPAVAARVTARPFDPRAHVTPPDLDALDENPLTRLSGWAVDADQPLLRTEITAPPGTGELRLRLAVLPRYDGVTWRVGGVYRPAGRLLPPAEAEPPTTADPGGRQSPAGPDGPVTTVVQRITVDELSGALLPTVPDPYRVDGVRIGYDQVSGTAAVPGGLRPGLTYTVVSRRTGVDVNLLPAADVPSGPDVADYLDIGATVPDDLTRLAQQIGEGSAEPYQRASAIEQFLAEHYRYVTDAPSGHALPNLRFFLLGRRDLGGQRGTSEQFAAAFAVLGRILGLPTRVVVGFRVRPGAGTVRGSDALAWPEVLFTGIGWVPFDPLPHADTPPRPVEDDIRPRPQPSTAPPSVAPTPALSPPTPPVTRPPHATGVTGGTGAGPLAFAGALAVLAAAACLVTIAWLRRRLREKRLGAASPADRITGAWLEILDGLRLARRPAPVHLTTSEVVAHAATVGAACGRTRLPTPPLDDLGAAANLVTFAPYGVPDETADRATAQAVAYLAELRRRQPRRRRLLWSIDPRPLRWHRHRPHTADPAASDPVEPVRQREPV
ncbi:MAG TPA: transglutaminaseTgpA domain-containing protein [Micromonosporaceae bacterium]